MKIWDETNDKQVTETCHTVGLTSAGISSPADLITIRKNGRTDFSLFFCKTGCIHIESHDTEVVSGQVFLYPAHTPQRYVTYASEQTVYHYLHFTGVRLEDLIHSLKIPTLLPIPVESKLFSGLFEKIEQASLYDDAHSLVTVEYLILRLLSLLATASPRLSPKHMMLRVTDQMKHDYSLPYDAQTYARMFSISVSRFNHLFKEIMGLSPLQYYIELRMENACLLLECTDLTVVEVSEQIGYHDSFYFSRLFKKYSGVSPTSYRKANRFNAHPTN